MSTVRLFKSRTILFFLWFSFFLPSAQAQDTKTHCLNGLSIKAVDQNADFVAFVHQLNNKVWGHTYRSPIKFHGVAGFIYPHRDYSKNTGADDVFFQIFDGVQLMDLPIGFTSFAAQLKDAVARGPSKNQYRLSFPYQSDTEHDEFVLFLDATTFDIVAYEYQNYKRPSIGRLFFPLNKL